MDKMIDGLPGGLTYGETLPFCEEHQAFGRRFVLQNFFHLPFVFTRQFFLRRESKIMEWKSLTLRSIPQKWLKLAAVGILLDPRLDLKDVAAHACPL